MIQGFETYTAELTAHEQEHILPLLVRGLSLRHGQDNAISNKEIVSRLNARYHLGLTNARVRKIINHIRVNDLLPGLIATSRGYYIATSEKEITDYEESLLGRENAIRAVRLSMQRQRKAMYHPEQNLFV